jgi:hypothetical protein
MSYPSRTTRERKTPESNKSVAYCPPFAGYRADPNSVFMTKAL